MISAPSFSMTKTKWMIAVEAGAHKQTMNRLQYHSRKAIEERRERLSTEFETAWTQRIENARAAWEEKKRTAEEDFSRTLTLEELGRLYMKNLGTQKSTAFWRFVKRR